MKSSTVIKSSFYENDLLPAAPVEHGYQNIWIRDMFYVGICSPSAIRKRAWKGLIKILDTYTWKLKHHVNVKPPKEWYEYMHVRYSPKGYEICEDHWQHNQWDCIGNWLHIAVDENRPDLAELLVNYLNVINYAHSPAAGAWEDRHSSDAYTIAACMSALEKAKKALPDKIELIDKLIEDGNEKLGMLLPHANPANLVCLSLLGVIWPYNLAGSHKEEIISLVTSNLMREPYGFIRYYGDTYDGEGFSRRLHTEMPWVLGDLFMAHIQPEEPKWKERLEQAYQQFKCMPEGYFPETLCCNRNSPLLWAEAMYESIGKLNQNPFEYRS